MQAKSNIMWNTLCMKFSVSPFCLCYLNVRAHTQRATGCASYLSHVSKITSSGQWCNVTRTDTIPALCFLVCEESSQGLCWWVWCVCVCVCVYVCVCVSVNACGRERGERGHWCMVYHCMTSLAREKKNPLFKVSLSLEVSSHATQKPALLQKGFAGYP